MKTRRKLVVTGAAVALGAAAVTAGITTATGSGEKRAASSVAAAEGTTWPIVQSTPTADKGNTLSGLATAPDGTMWAAGGQYGSSAPKPILQRLTGDTWTGVALPAAANPYYLNAVAATSASNLWLAGQLNVSGDTHAVLHWNGKTWSTVKFPLTFQPSDIATTGAGNAWVVSPSAAKHWNGTAWADTPIGVKPRALTAVSPTSAWVVGWAGEGKPATAHWNGTSWTTIPFPDVAGTVRGEIASALSDVYAASDNDVWAVGAARVADATGKASSRSMLAHWNGTKWTNVLGAAGTSLSKVASDGAGGIWVTSGSTLRHRTKAGVWSNETLAQPAGTSGRPSALALRPGTTTMWAVGSTTTTATGWADLAHWRSK
ncbi:hypothetical protein [Actinomadura verrucosospora]|uniref:ErfK/YbiS/YcfS/YnhG family protein n=1 Tax=Actinomadura verrucosospora TaxID=46165 RepID=A0A7D3VWA7_ACTVE|nr:hypothetical protein [Actinomadura verrucosospora]QKG25235.1 ErfK/YbiS/YcfS/YnhG family protein [Actinomadura verrucosospora]